MFIQKVGRPTPLHPVAALVWIIFATLRPLNLPGAEPAVVPAVPVAAAPAAPTNPINPTNPPIREISPGLFQMGDVRFDRTRRTIQFPALVNMREGNIEYVVVHATGKTHESLLRTTVQPMHVQLAFLLLGAKGDGTNALPADPAVELPGDALQVELSWLAESRTNRAFAEEFVLDRKAGAQAGRGAWVYTGSRLREDGFAAQLDGSIVSLITDPDALINNPRRGREDDDNWLVRTNGLPPLHALVEVTLRLGK